MFTEYLRLINGIKYPTSLYMLFKRSKQLFVLSGNTTRG